MRTKVAPNLHRVVSLAPGWLRMLASADFRALLAVYRAAKSMRECGYPEAAVLARALARVERLSGRGK